MESDQNECTVHVSGLTAFTIEHFEHGQSSGQEKSSFESVTPVSCFNEAVASQDGSIMTRYKFCGAFVCLFSRNF